MADNKEVKLKNHDKLVPKPSGNALNASLRRYIKLSIVIVTNLMLSLPISAAERILDFHSHVRVFENSAMEVTETIRVRAEGRQIRQGIYRNFSTKHTDRFGNQFTLRFDLKRVTRDGQTESFHVQQQDHGIRLIVGEQDAWLSPGEYTYTITYRINRQIDFIEDHDELYWNVTGNAWAFPIDHASAKVFVPSTIPVESIGVAAYTGTADSQGQDYLARINADGSAEFDTTQKLAPYEGLTIVTSWPSGYVAAPSKAQQFSYFLSDNRNLAWGLTGLVLLLVYYLLSWLVVGRDPEAGTVTPQYLPPQGFSPASMRFIDRMDYDHKTFAAAIVNLAIKGHLTIAEQCDAVALRKSRRSPKTKPAPGEPELIKMLFAYGDEVTLEQSSHQTISDAIKAHKRSLKRDYQRLYFMTNSVYHMPGLLITLGLIIASVTLLPGSEHKITAGLLASCLAGLSLAWVVFLRRTWIAWNSKSPSNTITTSSYALLLLVGVSMGGWALTEITGPGMVLVLIIAIAINIIFYYLLRAPTLAGRKLLEKIRRISPLSKCGEKRRTRAPTSSTQRCQTV